MSHSIDKTAQVAAYIKRLPPEAKKELNRALSKLAKLEGDIKPLRNELEGFYRLRVGHHRVVFLYGDRKTIVCVYARHRSRVYEEFLPN